MKIIGGVNPQGPSHTKAGSTVDIALRTPGDGGRPCAGVPAVVQGIEIFLSAG